MINSRGYLHFNANQSVTAERIDIDSILQKRSAKRIQTLIKRVMDLFGAAIAIVVLFPLFCSIAFVVYIQDGGDIIFRRRVVGLRGEFDAYKFRTMRTDADRLLSADPTLRSEFEKNFKLVNDPRVTRWGSFLRTYSLDELPQLINVLKGEMSLVGPRMITEAELERYGSYRDLFRTVKPGITGYWQVNGRQTVSYNERIEMDVKYIQHWNLWLDFRILCKTPSRVIRAEGAY